MKIYPAIRLSRFQLCPSANRADEESALEVLDTTVRLK